MNGFPLTASGRGLTLRRFLVRAHYGDLSRPEQIDEGRWAGILGWLKARHSFGDYNDALDQATRLQGGYQEN